MQQIMFFKITISIEFLSVTGGPGTAAGLTVMKMKQK